MKFTKGQGRIETVFSQTDKDRIWELFFGKKWGINHIAKECGGDYRMIAGVIDGESERRWRISHPHETNREKLISEE